MKISGVVIAKNEERSIRRCIESYIDITNEFILVDTGSTDNTVQIAQECGARVEHFAWNDSFADARNYALSLCKGDWIIMLDADEWFEADHAKAFWEVLLNNHGNRKYKGVMIFLYDVEADEDDPEKFTEGTGYRTMRCLRNTPDIRFSNAVHERALYKGGLIPSYIMADDSIRILHDGYREAIQHAKSVRNLRLNMRHWEETGDPEYLHYIAVDYYRMGEDEKGLTYFWKLFESEAFIPFFGTYPHFLAHRSMVRLAYPQEKIDELVDEVYRRYPQEPSAMFLKAENLFSNNRLIESYAYYEKAVVELGDNPLRYVDFGLTIGKLGYALMLTNLAQIDAMRGDDAKAQQWLLRALQLALDNKKVFEALAKQLRKMEPAAAIEFWRGHLDEHNLENVELAMTAYRKVKPGIEFLYFFEKWFLHTGKQDLNYITMLILIENFREAFDKLIALQKESTTVVFLDHAYVVAFLAGHTQWLDEDEIWPAHYKVLREAIVHGKAPHDDAWGLYITLLNKLALFTQPNESRMEAFLRCARFASENDKLLYLDILHQSGHLLLVEPFIDDVVRSESPKVRAQGYRVRMMMRYEQGDYQGAKAAQGMGMGYDPQSALLKDYGQWIDEKIERQVK